MNALEPIYAGIHALQQEPELLTPVIEQISKDFALQGMGLDHSDPTDPVAFFQGLRVVVQQCVDQDFPSLLNILYRIDIPEKRVARALQETDEDAALVLIRLIVERECQKVLLRRSF